MCERSPEPTLRGQSSTKGSPGSPELGSTSNTQQYHKKTGRPIRRGAGQSKPVAGYVDSAIIEQDAEEPIETPSEDEDGQIIKPTRKRKRTRSPSPAPPPLDPVVLHEDPDEPTDDETGNFHHKSATEPIVLQFNVPLGFHGPLMVKLDPSMLVWGKENGAAQDMQPNQAKTKNAAREAAPESSVAVLAKTNAEKTNAKGFTDLPAELRNKVYRHLFVHSHEVTFPPREQYCSGDNHSLCWSAQLLRTCRLVHSEGCSVLYGENTFHFDRNKHTRGPFWQSIPKEIGYTDVRHFLKAIGSENLAYLRDIHIWLEDATPSTTPYLGHEARRYINDNHLIDCLRILRGAKLRKVHLTFGGRRNLGRSDVKMLGYLEQIKADEVTQKAPGYWYPQKVSPLVFEELKSGMTRKKKLYSDK
jgi:hypothetical protein